MKAFSKMSQRCLFKTLSPLVIVFKETLCKTRSMESGMEDTVIRAHILETGGTFDRCKECTKIKSFPCSWRYKIKAPDGRTTLLIVPSLITVVPNEMKG